MITISEALKLLKEENSDKTWKIEVCTYIGGVGSKASYKTLEDNIIDYEEATKKAKNYFNNYKKSEKFNNFEIRVIEVFNDGAEDVVDVYDNKDSEPFKDLNEGQGAKRIKREINDKLISDLMNPEYNPKCEYMWDFVDKKTGRNLTTDSYINAELGVIKLYNGWGDVIKLPIDGSAKPGSPKDINRYEVYEYVD